MKIKFENKEELCYYANMLDHAFGCPKQYMHLDLNVNCQKTVCINCWHEILENLSDLEESESSPDSKEKHISLDRLYDAVCRETTLYEEHDTLNTIAEQLKNDIFESLEHTYGMLLDCVECHTMQALKGLYDNWSQLSWADYSDEDHIEYLYDEVKKMLADSEKDMYQLEEMKSVLHEAVNAAAGVYGILLSYVLEECESEQDYYEMLVLIQNYWDDISWKNEKDEPEDEVIRHFTGKYEFLSNAYESAFEYQCISFRNAEAAYQASKTEHETIRKLFSDMNAKEANKTGKTLVIHDSWDRLAEMRGAVWAKFFQSPELTELLKDTKDAVLAPEGIGTFWGMKDGKGENHLGKILMDVRDQLFAMECEFSKEIEEFFKAIDDYEKGVINVDRMTSATANLAKCLIEGEHALLIADLSEVLEESENVPKALYDMMRKYVSVK